MRNSGGSLRCLLAPRRSLPRHTRRRSTASPQDRPAPLAATRALGLQPLAAVRRAAALPARCTSTAATSGASCATTAGRWPSSPAPRLEATGGALAAALVAPARRAALAGAAAAHAGPPRPARVLPLPAPVRASRARRRAVRRLGHRVPGAAPRRAEPAGHRPRCTAARSGE